MRERINTHTVLVGNPKGKRQVERDLRTDGRIILKCVLNILDVEGIKTPQNGVQ
jgi:hypothetical protein